MRVNPKPLWSLVVVWLSGAGLLLEACSKPSPTADCIQGDLGRFHFERARPLPDGGCQAHYRADSGKPVRVEVTPYSPGMFDSAGNPVSFGQHKVFLQPVPEGARVGWFSGNTAVRLLIPGAQQAEGPVVRAYLIRYPSAVDSLLQTMEHDVGVLRASSRQAPRKSDLHLQLARKYEKLGNRVMATQEYHICIDVDPGAFDCFLELGNLYFALRHWDLSIRALRKACRLKPQSAEAWLSLGGVYRQVKNVPEAREVLNKVLSLNPTAEQRAQAMQTLSDLSE